MSTLAPLMQRNYLEYASYSILDRAIPDQRDGCKPVQRRILQTMHEMDDGKFHKVANVVGECMKLHPHGDASIGDALVVLANKDYFVERQGNFGNVITGHRAAAARYIECRLTPLARETLFNKHLTEFQPSYDGRKAEIVWLPAKLPVVLMLGTDGIAVGMATKILPHNFCELLQAQIALLRNEAIELYPDFPQGGIMDVAEYDDGRGRVRVRARIEADGDKRVVIREIPYGTTTESIIASIEAAAQKNKVKISGINDYTTEQVEIEILLQRGVYAREVIPQLYAYTDCEVSVSSNLLVIDGGRPEERSVTEILVAATKQLRTLIKQELEWELGQLQDKHHWLTLEQIFIEHRVYKQIEECPTSEAVQAAVYQGMQVFQNLFVREMVDDDVERLLEIRIRRISRYDIDKNRRDIDDIVRAIKDCRSKLRQLTEATIRWLQGLLDRYGAGYQRRTQIGFFEEVDKRAVARSDIKVCYDKQSGFIGTGVRGSDLVIQCSEFDRLLIILQDGSFRVIPPPEKELLPGKVVHCELFDAEAGQAFVLIYRDDKKFCYGKRFRIEKFIKGKVYRLIKDENGRVDLLLPGDAGGSVQLSYAKAPRQRVSENDFDLATLEETGMSARGTRLAPKPVARVKYQK